jgi:membrane dipeptidase
MFGTTFRIFRSFRRTSNSSIPTRGSGSPSPRRTFWPTRPRARSRWSSAGKTGPRSKRKTATIGGSAGPPKTKLREYYELGLRTANLAYQISNQFGGGLLDPEARLTSQGKYIIGKMQDLGILVDVCGHTGVQTALDVIAMARRPVVITHGTCRALNDNPRGSPDKVIEGVARTGGLMGIAAIDVFLTWGVKDAAGVDTGLRPPRATVARYVDEFDHLKRLVGINHIAFGTDFTTDVENADPSQLFEIPPEMMYKEGPKITYVDGFESVSDIGNVRAEMEKRGYTAEEIAKVFGGNWMRVFGEAWNS